VGAYAGSEILKSYSSIQTAFLSNQILEGVERPKICKKPAIALNLAPDTMWSHPTYGNIDASIGCIASFKTQTFRSMNVTSLSLKQYTQGLLQ
jgi:hypothetical protein